MAVLREILARFGVEVDAGPLANLNGSVDSSLGKLRKFGATLAGAFAIGAVRAFASEMAQAGDEIDEASARLGISTTELQVWRHAANLAGVGASQLDASFKFLQRSLVGASEGGAEQARVFRTLGVEIEGADGQIRSMDALLPDIADGFARVENPTERAGLAMKVFGRDGTRLLPLLEQGSAGVEELRREFERLGGGMNEEAIKAAVAYADETDRLNLAFFSLKSRIAAVLLPVLTRFTEVVTNGIAAFQKMAEGTRIIEVALAVLGAAALAFGIKFLIGFAGPIAIAAVFAIAIAFIILVLEDLIGFMEGKKSVIGGFIDELFGIGTAAQFAEDLRQAWEGIAVAIEDAGTAFKEFFGQEVAPGEDPKPLSDYFQMGRRFRLNTPTADEQFQMQAQSAAEQGQIVQRNEQEPFALAHARFMTLRRSALDEGRIAANAEDVRMGLARREGFVRPQREGRRTRGGSSNTTSVDNRTEVSIEVAPGTDRRQLEAIRNVVLGVINTQNREAIAALGEEAVEE